MHNSSRVLIRQKSAGRVRRTSRGFAVRVNGLRAESTWLGAMVRRYARIARNSFVASGIKLVDGFLDGDRQAEEQRAADVSDADRRMTKAACAETTMRGEACRAIPRWRCESCDRNTCANHVVRLSVGPLCAICKQQATPLMRRGNAYKT